MGGRQDDGGEVEVDCLGPVVVTVGEEAVDLGRGNHRAALVWLGFHRWDLVPVSSFASVWPTATPELVRRRVGEAQRALAARLGADALDVGPRGVRLGSDVRLAHLGLSAALDDAETARARGDVERARLEVDRVRARWRGTPFPELADLPEVQAEVARLELVDVRALELWAELMLVSGRPGAAVGELQLAVHDYPTSPGLWAALMAALCHAGRQAEALRTGQVARSALGGGAAPDVDRIAEVEQAILSGEPVAPATTPRTTPGAGAASG